MSRSPQSTYLGALRPVAAAVIPGPDNSLLIDPGPNCLQASSCGVGLLQERHSRREPEPPRGDGMEALETVASFEKRVSKGKTGWLALNCNAVYLSVSRYRNCIGKEGRYRRSLA